MESLAVKEILEMIQKVFPLKSTDDFKGRHHFELTPDGKLMLRVWWQVEGDTRCYDLVLEDKEFLEESLLIGVRDNIEKMEAERKAKLEAIAAKKLATLNEADTPNG